MEAKLCKVPGCSNLAVARGMCRACYQRWWRAVNRSKTRKYSRLYREQLLDPDIEKERLKLWRRKHRPKRYLYNKKWRKNHRDKRNAQRWRNYQRGTIWAVNIGLPYDDFEKQMILDKTIVDSLGKVLKENVSDRELAAFLGRSVQAIQVKRHQLKKYKA